MLKLKLYLDILSPNEVALVLLYNLLNTKLLTTQLTVIVPRFFSFI